MRRIRGKADGDKELREWKGSAVRREGGKKRRMEPRADVAVGAERKISFPQEILSLSFSLFALACREERPRFALSRARARG